MHQAWEADAQMDVRSIDRDDFDWIVRHHQKRVYRVLLVMVKDAWILPGYDTDALNATGGDKVYDADDNGIKKPVVINMPNPPYTDEAREANAEGLVLLQAVVRKDGSVDSFKVLRGVGYGLDESAIRTIAKEWKFAPGRLNGKPVDSRVTIKVSFRRY